MCGRNGAGKSSFAEAAELLLTGDNMRWSDRSKVWQDGWRNVHAGDAAEIKVGFTATGDGCGELARTWRPGVGYDQFDSYSQFRGRRRQTTGALGWADAMRTYRPFLSAAEMNAVLQAKPSALYDAFHPLLGLDGLSTIEHRLTEAVKRLRARREAAKKLKEKLHAALRTHDDPRAAKAAELLAAARPDTDELARLATDSAAHTARQQALHRLAALRLSEPDEVRRQVEQLAAARQRRDELAGTSAAEARDTADLLARALAHRERHGTDTCPVCGTGALDADWESATRLRSAELAERAREIDAADREAAAAVTALHAIAAPRLAEPDAGIDTGDARAAWQAWQELLAADNSLVTAGTDCYERLVDVVQRVRAEANSVLDQLGTDWRPMATQISAWLRDDATARQAAQALQDLVEARGWLTNVAAELRAAALAPIRDAATEVWSRLRHNSRLTIGELTLVGTPGSNRRRLDLPAELDGTPCPALAAASQGELHALALALFLPRATNEASPFRFVVIDDPVQSMDPARVHALAAVLGDEAQRRQVIVFTHDDRLPAAARDLQLANTTILHVTRGERSAVRVEPCDDPVGRYVRDAGSVLADPEMPEQVKTVIVAGLLRDAVDASCQQRYRVQQYAEGADYDEVEEQITAAKRTKQLLALSIDCDSAQLPAQLNRLRPGLFRSQL